MKSGRSNEFAIKYGDMEIYRETLAAFAAITGKENLINSIVDRKGGEEMQKHSTWERWENEIKEEVRKEGIEAFILDNLEEGISKERILEKLQKRFSLTAEQAKEYFDKYALIEA